MTFHGYRPSRHERSPARERADSDNNRGKCKAGKSNAHWCSAQTGLPPISWAKAPATFPQPLPTLCSPVCGGLGFASVRPQNETQRGDPNIKLKASDKSTFSWLVTSGTALYLWEGEWTPQHLLAPQLAEGSRESRKAVPKAGQMPSE